MNYNSSETVEIIFIDTKEREANVSVINNVAHNEILAVIVSARHTRNLIIMIEKWQAADKIEAHIFHSLLIIRWIR